MIISAAVNEFGKEEGRGERERKRLEILLQLFVLMTLLQD